MIRKIRHLFTLLIFSTPLFATNLTIQNTTNTPGVSVEIPINIDDATNVAGYQFTITYNPDVLQATGILPGTLTAGWYLTPNINNSGKIILVGLDDTNQGISGGSGSLSILKFDVIGNVGATSNLDFTECKLKTSEANDIPSVPNNGSFKVKGFTISGKISLQGGSGDVTDVNLSLLGTTSSSTTPDFQGNYVFTQLPLGKYTITPTLNNYAFTPPNKSYTNVSSDITDANFAGLAFASLSGVIFYSGVMTGKIYVGIYNSTNYSQPPVYSTIVSPTGTYTINNISPGTYYIVSFKDVNSNQEWDIEDEPSGFFVSNPITIFAGENKTDINISLTETLTFNVVSPFGTPNPCVGRHPYATGDRVIASAPEFIESTGVKHICTGWLGTGNVPSSGTTNSTSFNITQNSSITWKYRSQHQLNVTTNGNGIVDIGPVTTNNWYDTGTSVTLTSTPDDGWFFSHWEGDIIGSTTPVNLTMDSPKNITAHFLKKNEFHLNPETTFIEMVLDEETTQETFITVGIEYIGEYTETINLTASVLPLTDNNITLEVTPTSISPPKNIFMLDIKVSEDVRPDTYIITIKGDNDLKTETVDITLTISTKLYIPNIIMSPSDLSADIPIKTTNTGGIKEFQCTLLYDPLILDISQLTETISGGTHTDTWTFETNLLNSGKLYIKGVGNTPLNFESGTLVVIKPNTIKTSFFPKEGTPLNLENITLFNEQGDKIPYIISDGKIYEFVLGNINLDGENVVNISDVILCLRMSIGLDVIIEDRNYSKPYPEWLTIRGDLNKDKEINISDVILVLRKSIGLD